MQKCCEEMTSITQVNIERSNAPVTQKGRPAMKVLNSTNTEILVKENGPKKDEGVKFHEIQDLTALSPLNETSVSRAIEARYKAGKYHTWAGVPLVVINPFQDVSNMYSDRLVEQYKNGVHELPPHIFAVGQKAYTDLKRDLDTRNQSIIISGESGAGKTWNTRHLMKYLTDAAEKRFTCLLQGHAVQLTDSEESIDCIREIEQRILDSNPVLEAFGNAQTLRNENSSRFGKYIQLHFDRQSQIVGATVQTYLLEKTRVVCQSEGERNFHIFCQMFPETVRREACLQKEDKRFTQEAAEDPLKATKTAMRNIGIRDAAQSQIFKVLCGIQKLCELNFSSPGTHNDSCTLQNSGKVCSIGSLLGLQPEELRECFTLRRISAGSSAELFLKPCTADECRARRNCMAKLLYSSLFEWIVTCINKSIEAPEESRYSFIGLLDIYGFESFSFNSLEQLCINYANEKLQQHFVYHFLKKQQEEYRKECVEWDFQEFVDNRPCLDLMEGKVSVFSLMNEECRLNRALDTKAFSERLDCSLLSASRHFERPRLKTVKSEFIIHHYADSVCYQVDGLVEKNKDQIPPELEELLESSSNWLVQELVTTRSSGKVEKTQSSSFSVPDSKRRQTNVTVVSKFKTSLDSLMSTLRSTSAHYIRCIKPNTVCRPALFDAKQVLSQLKACGVIETIRISAAGYPIRMTHREFLRRYSILLRYLNPGNAPNHVTHLTSTQQTVAPAAISPAIQNLKRADRRARRRRRSAYDHMTSLCRTILDVTLPVTEWKENLLTQTPKAFKLGRTKIYFREEEMERLENLRTICVSRAAFVVQCCWRRYKRSLDKERNVAATKIQKVLRCWLKRTRYQTVRRAVVTIQRYTRRHLRRIQTIKPNPRETNIEQERVQSTLKCSPAQKSSKPQCKQPSQHSWLRNQSTTRNPMTHSCHVMLYGRIGSNSSPLALWESINTVGRRQEMLHFAAEYCESTSRLKCRDSSGIASVRRIEEIPIVFHCRATPLPYANTRPRDSVADKGLAEICSLLLQG